MSKRARDFLERFTFHRSLRGELVAFFLIVLLVPLAGVSLLTLSQMQNTLREQMSNKLIALRDLKAGQVREYYASVNRDIIFSANLPTVVEAVREFGREDDMFAIRRLGYLDNPDMARSGKNAPYDEIHARYFDFFRDIIAVKGYYDIYLVAPNGDVVYNYDKGNDFATNLKTGPYRDTSLGDLFREIQASPQRAEASITDFVIYGPSGGEPASFAGAPIVRDGQFVGALIVQLPVDQVNKMLHEVSGMGETGETYLVGSDYLMRSDSRFYVESSILKQEVRTVAAQNALAGEAGIAEIANYRGVTALSAYQPIEIGNLKWALIAEVDSEEFFAPANRLRSAVLGVIALSALVIGVAGFVVASQIVKPISGLTVSAQKIGAGNLEAQVAETARRDEIGMLARAFAKMQGELAGSYRDLEKRVAERTRDLNVASNITRQISQALDTEKLPRVMVNQIKDGFNLYAATIYLYDPETQTLNLEATTGEETRQARAVQSIHVEARPSLVAQSVREQKRVVINDVARSDLYLLDASLPDVKSEAIFPLMLGSRILGSLDLVSEKTERFGEADLQILSTLSEQVSIAVHNAQLYESQVRMVDDLRRAQERLELYRFWFEGSPDPIITYDVNGIVQNANAAFEETFGWKIAEIAGKRLDFVPEESRHTIKGLIETLYRDGKVVAAGDAKRCTKDGRVLDVQLSAALLKNDAGEVAGNLSIFRDVTLQKQMEKRIAERTRDLDIASDVARQITQVLDTEELLQLLVNKMKEGFGLYAATVYLFESETRELALEATTDAEERQMKKALARISLDARPSLVAQAARGKTQIVLNDVSQSPDYLLDPSLPEAQAEAVFPMVIGAHLIGVLDLVSDKAQRFSEEDVQILNTLAEQIGIAVRNAQLYSVQVQSAAELRRADEMKTQFHSSVSHELRTPLNAIINFVEMVVNGLAGPVADEQKTLLELVLQSSTHLLSQINDILDMSKIQAGKMTLFVEDNVDLYEMLDGVIGVAATMFKDKPVGFDLDIDQGLPAISCDKRRIRQILLNLLSNANKFTERGTVMLRAKNRGDHVLFSVSDTGQGIPAALLPVIFEPYVQTAEGAKKEQGTGLGLPISRSFARAHDGELWVESIEGKGSTFFFTLPYQRGGAGKV